ncbi:MAG: phosphohydrolase [Desulfobacteraceae bacterium]|nr:phosphohydrolase [Desulfobacteraceae bacterium]
MKCPGQDTQFWTQEAIYEAACPKCGGSVEFFKDDTTRKCHSCKHRFVNPKLDFGCAAYCAYAEQCLGDLPPELVAEKQDLLKDRVAVAVKRHLKSDFKSIGLAARRAQHAESIARAQQADVPVLLMAAYLWDLKDSDSKDQTSTIRTLMVDLKAPGPLINKVCNLVSGQQEQQGNQADIAAEAAGLALLEDQLKTGSLESGKLKDRIKEICRTQSGTDYARKLFEVESE